MMVVHEEGLENPGMWKNPAPRYSDRATILAAIRIPNEAAGPLRAELIHCDSGRDCLGPANGGLGDYWHQNSRACLALNPVVLEDPVKCCQYQDGSPVIRKRLGGFQSMLELVTIRNCIGAR